MLIEFPEVFNTVPTDFYCVNVEQDNNFTFTVKELTRSYAIVTVKSSLSWNSLNDFEWKAVAYNDGSSNLNEKIVLELSSTVTLVRIGNIVQICFSGCKANSVPDIPTEHLPITNSTILAFSNDGTNNFFLRVIYKSDGTKGVYKGGDSVSTSNYPLYGSGTWLAN